MDDPYDEQERVQLQPTALKEILSLQRVENNFFTGISPRNPRWGRVYGGQIAAQSIAACVNTINPNTHSIHSFHGYFIRPGDDEVPILYKVTRLKDTKAYITRRVDAIQYEQIIFTCLLQFASPDLNVHSHTQVYDMSTIPSHDTLPSLTQDMFDLSTNENLPLRNRQLLYYTAKREIPFDIKWIDREDVDWVNWSDMPMRRPARRLMWVKIKGKISLDGFHEAQRESITDWDKQFAKLNEQAQKSGKSENNKGAEQPKPKPVESSTTTTMATVKKHFPNPESTGTLLGNNIIKQTNEYIEQKPNLMSLLQSIALTYMSDWGLIATAMKPHPFPSLSPHLQLASLDHSIHFFSTNIRADDWLLFDVHSPHFSNSKALLCGDFYTQNGELICRVTQEALVRVKNVDIVSRYPSFYISDTSRSAQKDPNNPMAPQNLQNIQTDSNGLSSQPQPQPHSQITSDPGENDNKQAAAPSPSIPTTSALMIKDSLHSSKVIHTNKFSKETNQAIASPAFATTPTVKPTFPAPIGPVLSQIESGMYSTARL